MCAWVSNQPTQSISLFLSESPGCCYQDIRASHPQPREWPNSIDGVSGKLVPTKSKLIFRTPSRGRSALAHRSGGAEEAFGEEAEFASPPWIEEFETSWARPWLRP
eukprot:s3836_g5.t1